jgi:hypothetical protein
MHRPLFLRILRGVQREDDFFSLFDVMQQV